MAREKITQAGIIVDFRLADVAVRQDPPAPHEQTVQGVRAVPGKSLLE